MAILTLAPDLGLDMALGIMPRGDLLEVYRRGSSVHSFGYVDDFGDEAEERFEGFGFDYDRWGDLAAGRITYQERYVGGALAFTLEGLDVSVSVVMEYVDDGDVEGELAYVFRGDDLIDGSDFDDRLIGMGGHDDIYGFAGRDEIYGESGDDYLRGGDDDDYLDGGFGWDDLHGNRGRDTLLGGDGDDWVVGGQDHDDLYGEDGRDLVLGNLGDDLIDGGGGGDILRGGQGFDSLSGGGGSDWLSGDRGDDTMVGGAGADTFHSFSDAGIDRVLDFSLAEGDRVQLDPGTTFTVVQIGGDTVIQMSAGQVVLVGVAASSLPPGTIFGA